MKDTHKKGLGDHERDVKYNNLCIEFYLCELLKKKFILVLKNYASDINIQKLLEKSFKKKEEVDKTIIRSLRELDIRLRRFMDDRNLKNVDLKGIK